MKNATFFILSVFLSLNVLGQGKGVKEAQFHVEGICNMCKDRIEETVNLSKGIKSASWDKESEVLTVLYKEKKTSPEDIGKALAKAGHDNDYAKATEEEYEKISKCCRYKTQEKH